MKTTFLILTSILFVFNASQSTKAAGPSPGPPYKQCSPSGYNCNILILVDKYGTVTVTADPNLQAYPPNNGLDDQLIGVQNNSSSAIHSISLVATTTHPDLKHFCGVQLMWFVPAAPNVKIVNIPSPAWTYQDPFFGSTMAPPYSSISNLDWGISCDLVFTGGLPKGGTSFFSLHGTAYYPRFRGFLKPVVAYVSFPADIKEGETVTGTIKIYPSPSPTPVTLALTTSTGTGSAVFASTSTFTQSGSFQITGAQRSSTAGNIRLSAIANGQEVSKTYFSVSSTDLQFPTGIAKGQTATANVIIAPSPSIGPVTLKLETTSGTGSAVFASNGSNTLDIYQSGDVQIRGIEASSTANNIRLSASTNGVQRTSKEFSVVWVTLSLQTGTNAISSDNFGKSEYTGVFGHGDLVAFPFFADFGCRVGAQITGEVTPRNYTGIVVLKRTKLNYGVWDGSSLYPAPGNPVTTPGPDTSKPEWRDDDPQSHGSGGKVYDLDAPGVINMDFGRVWRTRQNHSQYAVLDSAYNDVPASEPLLWYAAVSCAYTVDGNVLNDDVPNDNTANTGNIPLSWNLQ